MRLLVYELTLLLLLFALPVHAQLLNMSGGTGGGGGGGDPSYAPAVNPPGGQNNYAPIDSPTFTGIVTMPAVSFSGTVNFAGTVTLPNASLTDAMMASAYSGIGNCAAGSFVTGLNRNAAPSCGVAGTGVAAPLINPAGGQNNYLPINQPIWTDFMQGNAPGSNMLVRMFYNPIGTGGATYNSADVWFGQSAVDFLIGPTGEGEWSVYGSAPGSGGIGVGATALMMWEYDNPNQASPMIQVHNIDWPGGGLQETGFDAVDSINPGYPAVHHLWMLQRGDQFSGTAAGTWSGSIWDYPDSGMIAEEGMSGLAIGTTSGASVDLFNGGLWVLETNTDASMPFIPVRGAMLPGIGSPAPDFAGASGETALLIGANYFSTQSDYGGELNISSGMTPILGTWNWQADAVGAAMGGNMVSIGYGPWFGVYWADPAAAGTQMIMNPSFEAWGYELYPVHLANPGDAPVPSVDNGVLWTGSRDSFGWITNLSGDRVTLTFGTPFYGGESVCTMTDAGLPYLWYAANQSQAAVTFICVDPRDWSPCAPGAGWVEYHCGGLGPY